MLQTHTRIANKYCTKLQKETTTASLCVINTRSVRNKTTDILDYIHEHDLDIVATTDTWLTNKDSNPV